MNEEKYINQFIKERGHSWEKGFYVELQTGDVLFKSSEEYSFSEVKEFVQFLIERSENPQARYLENNRTGNA